MVGVGLEWLSPILFCKIHILFFLKYYSTVLGSYALSNITELLK